jgi:hypothetical protein
MFDVDAFVLRGHEKVIEHYRWLRDRSDEPERAILQQRMQKAMVELNQYLTSRTAGRGTFTGSDQSYRRAA